MTEQIFHLSPDEAMAEHFMCLWSHKSAPARGKKRRRGKRPQWAERLLLDRDAQVSFGAPIACPSCAAPFSGLDGGRGEIDDGGPVDVIRCGMCRAMVVLDLRAGTIRAPTDAERKRWRLTFWFVVMRDSQGD